MTDRAEVQQLLEAAAERLRQKGWCREDEGEAAGPNCVSGAIRWAAADIGIPGAHNWASDIMAEAWTALCTAVPAMVASPAAAGVPIAWNDYICPDSAAAIDMLLTAAKHVAAKAK